MARLRIRDRDGLAFELEIAPGERVLDALDEHGESGRIAAACRAANCGACRVRVVAGAALVRPPDASERSLLSEPDERLGCQLVVVAGAGELVLALPGASAPGASREE